MRMVSIKYLSVSLEYTQKTSVSTFSALHLGRYACIYIHKRHHKQSHVIAHITDNTVAGSVQGLEHAARREAADLIFPGPTLCF